MHENAAKVREKILPLSVAQSLPEAFREWSFTEETIDHGTPIATCELCEQEEIRYHFGIRNNTTGNSLWVGSQCILKFDLSVFEDGVRLDKSRAKRKLDHLVDGMRLESCLKALRTLADAENNDILKNALAFYEKNKYLTPKFANVVFWKLRDHRIDHSPSFFKISLKKDKYKEDLRRMPANQVHRIWPALSSGQRQQAMKMGHMPPA